MAKILKSNMDRFIEGFYVGDYLQGEVLKSNMDRFIVYGNLE